MTALVWALLLLVAAGGSVNLTGLRAVVMSLLVIAAPGLVVCIYLMRRHGFRPDPAGHTRCGGCGHILRGLSEPRCPECGRRL